MMCRANLPLFAGKEAKGQVIWQPWSSWRAKQGKQTAQRGSNTASQPAAPLPLIGLVAASHMNLWSLDLKGF